MAIQISNHAFQRMKERKGWDEKKASEITVEFVSRFQIKYNIKKRIKTHYLSYDGIFYWVISTNENNRNIHILTFRKKSQPIPKTEFFK